MNAFQFFASLGWADWMALCIFFGLVDALVISLALATSALIYRCFHPIKRIR